MSEPMEIGTSTSPEGSIESLITPSLEDMGYEVVRVMFMGADDGTILQIMAEHSDGSQITVEDCAKISRRVSAILDVEDPIAGNYTLEVSTPGLDRPLTRIGDFERFSGLEVKIETRDLIDGQKRFRGRLAGTSEDSVCLSRDADEWHIPFSKIHRAKLVMNDELLELSGKH